VTVPIAILFPIWVEYQSPRFGNENAHIFSLKKKKKKKKKKRKQQLKGEGES
jgi:hypothetical protein